MKELGLIISKEWLNFRRAISVKEMKLKYNRKYNLLKSLTAIILCLHKVGIHMHLLIHSFIPYIFIVCPLLCLLLEMEDTASDHSLMKRYVHIYTKNTESNIVEEKIE